MNSSGSIASGRSVNSERGLPRVNYYPPIVATLLAAIVIFVVIAVLCVIMALNTFTQLGHVAANTPGSSIISTGLCGILSLGLLVGVVYFLLAIIKGVRDLGAQVYYTRGTVVEQKAMSTRAAKNWLLVNPAYSGPNLYQASIVTDEQTAASADRSQIVQPRGIKGFPEIGGRLSGPSEDQASDVKSASAPKQSSYLNPQRISASANLEEPITDSRDKAPKPHVIFRSDFTSPSHLRGDEEVIVAHSPHLQHLYYIARLLNGEWEVYRNKALI